MEQVEEDTEVEPVSLPSAIGIITLRVLANMEEQQAKQNERQIVLENQLKELTAKLEKIRKKQQEQQDQLAAELEKLRKEQEEQFKQLFAALSLILEGKTNEKRVMRESCYFAAATIFMISPC